MASATIPIVPSSIQSRFDIISGREKCSLRLIASDGSVRFGFGALRTEPLRQSFVSRAAWELGTYYRSWRLCRQSSILCGGLDALDSIDGCQHELDCQDFGFFHGIVHLSAFDLRVLFSDDLCLDVFGCIGTDDEIFHLFCPDNWVITYSNGKGWLQGPSNKPWTATHDSQ